MKILDRFLLKSFLSTLFTVFAILYFIFILQAVWLFIAELAGKDLDTLVIIKFLIFYSPKMIPLVMPLSVLLASIMTFGSLAENYEFAAMKASGISLQRAMRPLTIFITILALTSFWVTNNIIPKAEFKFINLRKDIAHTKPAMAIAEGQFNMVGNINIKVDKKTGDDGQYLDNITMHMKSPSGYENEALIRAVNGELKTSETSNLLQLHLFDGNYYRDVPPKNYKEKKKHPFMKAKFDIYTFNMDLSALNSSDGDGQTITDTYHMLNARELSYTIDSLKTVLDDEKKSYTDNAILRIKTIQESDLAIKPSVKKLEVAPEDLLATVDKDTQKNVINTAIDYTSNLIFNTENNDLSISNQAKNLNSHYQSLYEKFIVSYSCFLMFFIGAPLGAIIRKGGVGLPMVFAVGIFITYHFINTFGRKVAQEDGMHALLGAWIGCIALTPLAIFLTYKATQDNGDVNFTAWLDPVVDFVKGLVAKFNKKEKNNINS